MTVGTAVRCEVKRIRDRQSSIFHAASNCPNGTVQLTVDDVVKGNYAMHPKATIKSFTVEAGAHTAEAREIGGTGLTWPRINFNVRENESFTLDMTCP